MADTLRCVEPGCGLQLVPSRTPVAPGQATHGGRGLCGAHFKRHKRAGTLHQFQRVPRKANTYAGPNRHTKARIEDYRFLLDSGETDMPTIAARLGVTLDALERMVKRHQLPLPQQTIGHLPQGHVHMPRVA